MDTLNVRWPDPPTAYSQKSSRTLYDVPAVRPPIVYVQVLLRPCWYTDIGAGLVTLFRLIELVVPLDAEPPEKSVSAMNVPTALSPQAIWMTGPPPLPEDDVVTFRPELCEPA